jgi:hypothetical protein
MAGSSDRGAGSAWAVRMDDETAAATGAEKE